MATRYPIICELVNKNAEPLRQKYVIYRDQHESIGSKPFLFWSFSWSQYLFIAGL